MTDDAQEPTLAQAPTRTRVRARAAGPLGNPVTKASPNRNVKRAPITLKDPVLGEERKIIVHFGNTVRQKCPYCYKYFSGLLCHCGVGYEPTEGDMMRVVKTRDMAS